MSARRKLLAEIKADLVTFALVTVCSASALKAAADDILSIVRGEWASLPFPTLIGILTASVAARWLAVAFSDTRADFILAVLTVADKKIRIVRDDHVLLYGARSLLGGLRLSVVNEDDAAAVSQAPGALLWDRFFPPLLMPGVWRYADGANVDPDRRKVTDGWASRPWWKQPGGELRVWLAGRRGLLHADEREIATVIRQISEAELIEPDYPS